MGREMPEDSVKNWASWKGRSTVEMTDMLWSMPVELVTCQ